MARIVWWQFSDLHFKTTDEFDRKRVLDALWDDVRKQAEEGLLPHFIAITGDIAFSGKQAEYQRAEEEFIMPLLERTGIDRNRLYFVPGNHDFDRDYLDALNKESVVALDSREKVNTFLQNASQRLMYLHPFSAYSAFVARVTQAKYFDDSPAYGYCDSFDLAGTQISLIGLNSAWACNYSQRQLGLGSDKGLLLLGEAQLLFAHKKAPNESLRITLIHHPLDWLTEHETASLRHELFHKTHFFHHGHVHQASEISQGYISHHKCFLFGAAACYDRRVGNDHYANGYSIITLDTGAGKVTLKLRKYSDAPAPHWTSNEDLIGEGSGGQHTSPVPSDWFGHDSTPAEQKQRSSLNEIYRSSSLTAPIYTTVRKSLDGVLLSSDTQLQFHRYEELACSFVSSATVKRAQHEMDAEVVSIFFGELMIRLSGQVRAAGDRNVLLVAVDRAQQQLDTVIADPVRTMVHLVATCWRHLATWDKPPHQVLNEVDPAFAESAVPITFLALSVLLFSNREFAFATLPLAKGLPETNEHFSFLPPSRARVLGHAIVELSVSAETTSRFMAVTLIRFHLERRMEQVTEAFASVSREFPFQAVRLQLLNRPDFWSEQQFTVDTVRIISLLMGKELYGEKSQDIWFRELLQNAIDACSSRRRIGQGDEASTVEIDYRPSERTLTIRDNGIGMSRWHIDHFFCRVGRSIWRSEELAQYTAGKTIKAFSIGKFGIGFLSVFEVAVHVAVKTRFCLESLGHQLKISSIEEPFFVQEIEGLEIGTEISVQFRQDKQSDLYDLAAKHLVYQPQGITFNGLPSVPSSPSTALDELTRMPAHGEQVVWYKSEKQLPFLNARLYVALPLNRVKPEKSEPILTSETVRIANGGISVYQSASDWIGDTESNRYTRSDAGLNGTKAILDFDVGQAPVTVSRNRIRVRDEEARRVLDAITELGRDVWERFAKDLFRDERKHVQSTRTLIVALNHSAKEDLQGWRRRRGSTWCSNESLQRKAVGLLLEFGVVEVFDNAKVQKSEEMSLRALQKRDEPVILTTKERLKSPLVQLYCSQVAGLCVVLLPDERAVDLLHECDQRWTRIRSDQDLWQVIKLNESRDWQLCSVMPPESALVADTYFKQPSFIALILPRRRANAAEVVGLHRNESSVAPRVLLNRDHILWKALEEKLKERSIDSTALADLLRLFFALVVDEKSKTRKERESHQILNRLLKMSDLPAGTPARISD